MDERASISKIARLPHEVRMELNQRILNGELAPQILPWLNGLPELQRICAEHFDGVPVSAKNLSDYRQGPYRKWRATHAKIESMKGLAEYSLRLAGASGRSLADGAAQLLAGRFLRALSNDFDELDECDEAGDPDGPPPAAATPMMPDPELAFALGELRKHDLAQKKLDQAAQKLAMDERALEQRDRQLALQEETAAWNVAAKVLKALRQQEIQRIDATPGNDEEKMQDITRIIFGDDLMERIARRRAEAQAEGGATA